ncbi:X-Pro aminopeptidase [Thioclava sp. SK-1]|uniref:aminopeptidase P family protein n=1 Tax=Thioclava sp. SK-1 TaxID=1889770 RepID=UPI0008253DEE|nr:aminopeptidase P family protein [Thioclava sp. SK-1]OCX66053.1 X-Pro aminopeptidase [Thioclava sp. SK-1]
MFQDFSVKTDPALGAARLAVLRAQLAQQGLDGFIIPRADAHQGEYVADSDARLAWLTGFTGSAGFCIALKDHAGVFIDGRYKVQVRTEVDLAQFTPIDWPATRPGPWLAQHLTAGAKVGFDPWLHTRREIDAMEQALTQSDITLVPTENLVDAIWHDRPAPPAAPARIHPAALAGEDSTKKRTRLARNLCRDQVTTAVLTQPDSICWLLNIRGADIPRNPLVQCFALLHNDAKVTLFAAAEKFDDAVLAHLGPDVTLRSMTDFAPAIAQLQGTVQIDAGTAPVQLARALPDGTAIRWADDPCVLPKSIKNTAEIAGMHAAHLRDATAMVEFLCWLDDHAPTGTLTEIDVVTRLENCRRATGALTEISFDTICGAGPNGAIVHYRVTEKTNRAVHPGELLLVDSGGQYGDGTTDITRTMAIGSPDPQAVMPFTRVLKGMIALSRARFPKGLAGRDLDALARASLWAAGLDYDHGTGHGVGAALCVHEGPARISRASDVALQPGMILSNEPGYYRENAFGIRIENLLLVEPAPPLGDPRDMMQFQTLTWVPIDRRLIDMDLLGPADCRWVNDYHAQVLNRIGPTLSPRARTWLQQACAPL